MFGGSRDSSGGWLMDIAQLQVDEKAGVFFGVDEENYLWWACVHEMTPQRVPKMLLWVYGNNPVDCRDTTLTGPCGHQGKIKGGRWIAVGCIL